MFDSITVSGFDFIKVGEFQFSKEPYQFKKWTSKLILKLSDNKYEKADETTYLIMHEGDILYVGEFTYNLKDRWLSQNHVNHHRYDKIESALNEEKKISLWLAISPFCEIDSDRELNVSKALEH